MGDSDANRNRMAGKTKGGITIVPMSTCSLIGKKTLTGTGAGM